MSATTRAKADPARVLTIILGGGQGSRLFPLTRERAKPAVPLAGKYRLVDIPISNSINSGMRRIYLLTQFLSASLHRHVYGSRSSFPPPSTGTYMARSSSTISPRASSRFWPRSRVAPIRRGTRARRTPSERISSISASGTTTGP
ncbi:MAG: glgC [candidate division NC10 bacterium]|nr:glgC [candidate division NC10 bacterium]